MKVKYIGHGDPFLTHGKVYDVTFRELDASDKNGKYGDVDLIDDEGDKYFMFDDEYEVVLEVEE